MRFITYGLDAFSQNLRYTLRKLFRNPGSSAAAVVAMALGIALTAWMYAIVDGIMLRGLPFEEADRLLHLERNNLSRDVDSMEVTQHDFEAWREQQQSFEGIAGFTFGTFNLADEDLPERYEGAWLSANFLDLLRVDPILGRRFTAEDEQPGAPSVVLLGHHVWRKRYGSDRQVIGRVIRVNSEPTTVVGVLPEDFLFPIRQDAWKPLILETHELRRGEGLTLEVFGRLKDGVTLDAAANEIATIARRLEQEYPDTNEGIGSVVKPYIDEYVGEDIRMLMGVMMACVFLVLLIACFNVANLLIGRASLRGRELAIRAALGSSRWQTVAQVLSESALVAAAGTVFGVVFANFGLRLFDTALATTEPPFWFVFELSPRVLLVVAGVAVASALISGIIPALQASRPDVGQILQDTSRGSTSFRLGKATRFLVVAEVAGSCALLIGAGLAVRSILAQSSYDLRFETDHLLNARIGLFEGDYPEDASRTLFWQQLQDKVASRAEVASAAVGTVVPADIRIGAGGTMFERPGESYQSPRDMPFARLSAVSPGYFETLGVKILAGRDFTPADSRDSAPVALVNEDFARKEWPGESPIGQRINLWMGAEEEAENPDAGWAEVVGMVPDLRAAGFDDEDDQQGIYRPVAQSEVRFAWIIARTRIDPVAFANPLRATVREIDPNLPLYFVRSMDKVLEETLFMPNLLGLMFSTFGAVALILACVGLYGVMAFAVTQRTQEMGVRMALGADRGAVLGLILRQGLTKVVVGLVPGIGLGALLGLALGSFLFQVRSGDPVTFVGVPAILLVISAVACLIPARRASAVDPVEALHHE